jgi:hypothetical protein
MINKLNFLKKNIPEKFIPAVDSREEDFGNYSCRAVNSLGRDQGHIVLSGNYICRAVNSLDRDQGHISQVTTVVEQLIPWAGTRDMYCTLR